MAIFWPYKTKLWPFFHDFLQMTSKQAQKHQIKKSEKSIHWKNFEVQKTAKMAENGHFFGPGGPNFDPFFTIFCKSLLNMPLNIILKNQKNSFTRKISKSKKVRKWQKKGQKWLFFLPWRAEFWPFFHNFLQITSKYASSQKPLHDRSRAHGRHLIR